MKKTIVYVFFTFLLLIPCVGLYFISLQEQKQYETTQKLELLDASYGEICQVERQDVNEYITVEGTGISASVKYMELNSYAKPYNIRFSIKEGDYVTQNQIIGYYNGKAVSSTCEGIVESINLGEDSYIAFQNIEDVIMQIKTNKKKYIQILSDENIIFYNEQGDRFSVIRAYPIEDEEGYRTFDLKCIEGSSIDFGVKLNDLKLYTGNVYTQCLVVDKNCVYSYQSEPDVYYIRVVDEYGNFKEEAEVSIGYEDENYICISGVEEGTLCDSGYKKLVEGNDQDE